MAGGALVPFLGLSVFGWLPILAGAAMALSSVTVVGNSILLGRYTPRYSAVKPKEEQQVYSNKELKSVYTPSEASAT
jgi:Cu+-exporting ATPase